MAIPISFSRVKAMLGMIGSSLRLTYNRLSNTDYKIVRRYSDDELTDEEKLHDSPPSDGAPNAVAPKPRGEASAYLTYSGWVSSVLLTFMLIWLVWYQDRELPGRCFREVSPYSPLLQEVPNTFIDTTRNGSIRWPSPYRGPPSPEVDRAWEEITIFRPLDIVLSDQEFLMVGKSPETAAKNAPEFGGGYFLQPEFSHQNLLRKASHFKYDYYKHHDSDFRDKDETFKVHFDHCVEMLRQFIMCHADVGVVTAHWIEQRDRPWPDFNTKQTCRDFDAVLKWTTEHQLPEGAPMMPLKPPGAKTLATPPWE
ncbi:hypothetical protein F4818DRAFT_444360 [Hypoxylon cercidicola]|nr:hypothetical protein F4818DRAFT_444360 [Hypoxylon cercidicola]